MFCEYTLDTVHCEFGEEIGQALTAVQFAGMLENIFQWGGSAQDEIVFTLTAAFTDEAAYVVGEQSILDARGSIRLIWRALDAASPPLYPSGVADLAAWGHGSWPPTNWPVIGRAPGVAIWVAVHPRAGQFTRVRMP